MITRKSPAEIATMRRAGRVVAQVLALVEEELRPGVSTARLDALAEAHIRKAGATPSFKGYYGYPSSLCISIDREVVHGIPGDRVIREGQVVSVDAGAIVDGWHGDAARTFVVGDVGQPVRDLVDATRRALEAGVAAARPGNRIWDVSAAVEDVALTRGYGIVRPYVGHGIGTAMHEEPQVPNYRTRTRGIELAPGICLAIEPMFTLGAADVETLGDGWTVVTSDGSIAAHWEDSIAVTENGPEVLTRP
ncbi:MAG TPA: type I methionyl aminopeptidase [Patescibacteria group bacterium]|nr:type I methionyl aminopeptidase [Patescibacteria group bacterium]